MKGKVFRTLAGISIILSLLLVACNHKLYFMSYNVQNLFDAVPSGREYRDYRQGWTPEHYRLKLETVARVIKSPSTRPDVIALQEVENLQVLQDLADHYLKGMGYRYVAGAREDRAAVGVGVISRVPILRTHLLDPGEWEGAALRQILEIELEYRGKRLYLFNNHWKSKSGSVLETEPARLQSAAVLVRRLQEILEQDPLADILIVGDFNENVEEYLEQGATGTPGAAEATALMPLLPPKTAGIYLAGEPVLAGQREGRLIFYEPWYELPRSRWGSYRFRGRWQTPDHILLSAGLFDHRAFQYRPGHFSVLRRDFLLKNGSPYRWTWTPLDSKADPGSPVRTEGFSDHLPLLLEISFIP